MDPKKRKKVIYLAISVFVVLFVIFMFTVKIGGLEGINRISGFAVSEDSANNDANGDSLSDSNNEAESTKNNISAYQRIKSGSGEEDDLTTQGSDSILKNVDIKADLKVERLEIPVSNVNINVIAEKVTVSGNEMDIEVSPDGPIQLKEFEGNILLQDSQLILTGKMYEYLGDYIKIQWKGMNEAGLKISNGSIEIDQIDLAKFDAVVSGTITFGSKLTLSLDKDPISISNYKGSFKSETAYPNTVILEGRVDVFDIQTSGFNMAID